MRYLKSEKLLFVMIVYVFITTYLMILNSTLYTNFINPLFWGGMIIYLLIDRKKNYIRLSRNKKYLKYMVIISCIHVTIYLYLGLMLGFSEKTNHTNLIVAIVPILGMEMARKVIVARNKNNKIVLILMTTLFVLVELNYHVLVNLYPHKEAFFEYVCEAVLPLIACNSLYTYLAIKASFAVPLIYRLVIRCMLLVLPIPSGIDWFMIATTGILSPTLIYAFFQYKLTKKNEDIRKKKQTHFHKISFAITLFLCINLILFMIGVFQYEPITILSYSMKPSFERGDVVIFKKLSNRELKEIPINQIIIYSIGKQNIAHRMIDKIVKNDTVFYLTKGDNNNVSDNILVETSQIKGIYMFHIKYIGYPAVWLYEYFNK